jgi:hypothetical protein
MKATIISHEPVPASGHPLELHRFAFILDDDQTLPRLQTVSLRTARVIVSALPPVDAFVGMLMAIVQTPESSYDSLLGQVFTEPASLAP